MIDDVVTKAVHGLFTPRKAKSAIFTFLTNQHLAPQAIDLRAHPWAL